MSREIKLSTVRGMDDLLPEEMAVKRAIEDVVRKVFSKYGYQEIETPTVEHYEVFEAKSGEELRERMFTFVDKSGRKLVLRPEMTAPVARLVATKLKSAPLPIRLGYIADCYRYDEPQWGRKRRFYHGGFELFGSSSPAADAEIIQIGRDVFNMIGLKEHFFKVGHVGMLRSLMETSGMAEAEQDIVLSLLDRKRFDEALSFMEECEEKKVIEKLINISGSAEEVLKKGYDLMSPWDKAIKALDNLSEIIDLARSAGVDSKIIVDLGFARGLAYYTGFIFEQYVPGIDIAFNGGGRYDKLTELFGGKSLPAVGCAVGITRIQQYLVEKVGTQGYNASKVDALLVSVSEGSLRYAVKAAATIRALGTALELDVTGKRIPAAIEYCEKKGIRWLVIVGEREAQRNTVTIRDLQTRTQVETKLDDESTLMNVFKKQ
ncbi:MAG: histidine--tRNA ligase [Thaumarchaeota archaeon]|jgi:histidyl-tRNA synthetase|nr:histidine--tRNA ligase [Candidatus Terraquivivens yellowstonensis]MCL7395658.1 histidine--tRNA ligase [Candidatus Terraquivivens yellowstonensis]